MAQYEQPTSVGALNSPSLDSLCQDLDSFISELKDTLPPDDRLLPSRQPNRSDSATHQPRAPAVTNYTPGSDAIGSVQPRVLNSRPPVPFYDRANNDENQNHEKDNDTSPLASPFLFPKAPETPVPVSPPQRSSSRRGEQSAQQQPINKISLDINSNSSNNTNSNNFMFMPRSSSLDRASSSSSAGRLNRLRSNGSTAGGGHGYRTMRIDEENEEESLNAALLSNLSQVFLQHVQVLNKTRRIFCTDEYPLSFNGEEAVHILRQLIPEYVKSSTYRKVARTLMHITPPLIAPIAYSEKSVRKNTLYESPHEVYTIVESTFEEGIAQGVYTPLTDCYSTSCRPGLGGCYAPCCPYRDTRVDRVPGGLRRNLSMGSSSVASSHDTSVSRAWQATVPREILQSTPEQEVKRQEAIHELIYTEEDYVRDLNLLDELFAKPLRTAQCIEPERRDAFCDNVFNNYLDILKIHKDLYRDLRDYQSLCQARSVGGFVDQVGDIFLRHINKFMAAYTEYGPHVVLGEYAVKRESSSNMLFQNFIRDTEKRAECRKLPFRHFLVLPVTRLQRYPLLLDAVLKRTPEDHPDKDDIARCIEIMRDIGSRMNELADGKRMTLRIYEINDRLKFKPGEPHDLCLREKGRKLLHEGPLMRRSHMGVESSELHVFLFDHLLLMTKPKGDYYQITKRPIPLELLHLHEGTEGFSLTARSMGSTTMSSSTGLPPSSPGLQSPTSPLPAPPPPVSNSSSSLIISHLGRHGGDYLLYAENPQQRLLWKQKIVEAKTILDQSHPERKVFEIRSLSDTTFGLGVGPSNHGKITCSTAFIGARGIRMVAIGTELGVWMGIEGDTNNLRKVLSIDEVTQIGVLEEHHIFLVLADKTLIAYALDSLDPTAPVKTNERPSYKIAHHVSFFSTGVCNGRTLVFVKKKKGIDSLFRGYEPVCGDLRDPRNAKYLQVKTGFLSKIPSWFKLYKEFYIGAEASALQFLKARLAVVCIRGFEIIDLNHLSQNHNLPELRDPSFHFVQERCEQLVPLGMFRCRDNYLLCYDEFAFMVDIKGRYVRDGYDRIDWEGNPQAVAFSYPYVVAFDPRFIEVRHVETGELVQILAGENMRCLQYKQNAITPPIIHGSMTHPFKPEFQYVFHLVGTFEPPLFWN